PLQTSQQCDSASLVQMVDISAKHCEYLTRFQRKPYLESPPLVRWAKARSHVQLSQDLLEELGLRPDGSLDSRESSLITPKGNVFLVAKLAAIQAAKNTPYLLPLCHQDGDVRSFLEGFEDVAEAVGVKADRAKLAALRMLLKGRAKAVLDATLLAPPHLDQDSEQRLLTEEFLDRVPPTVRDQLRVALITQPMTLEQLADAARQLLAEKSATVNEVEASGPSELYVILSSNDPSHISPVYIPRSFRSKRLLNSGVSSMVRPSILTTIR
ncbi:uncharacterized protein DEA37_0012778, partial [Paragonimus westermani]